MSTQSMPAEMHENMSVSMETAESNSTDNIENTTTPNKYKNKEISAQNKTITLNSLTREFVESLEPKVRKVDSDDNIDLFCYTTCGPDDPEYVKACRGLVFKGNELVLKAFSYTLEYTIDDMDTIIERIGDISKCAIFDSHEGAVIRVFYALGKWYVSTHRRLDAFRSKWASRTSFGEIFEQALQSEIQCNPEFENRISMSDHDKGSVLDKFISTLDTSKQYMFLLQNIADNRIVCNAPDRPTVFHVGTFTQRQGLDLTDTVNIPYPQSRSFTDVQDMMDYVEGIEISQLQGVIVFKGNEQFKIMNSEYQYFFNIRGNEPSVKYRYLQVRMDPRQREDLMFLYPDFLHVFDKYEDTLYDIVTQIKNAYIKRFIKKEFITVPPEEYSVMKLIHAWHLEDRVKNHVSTSVVRDILNQQTPSKLNKMIRRHVNEERLQKLPNEEHTRLLE